METTVTELPESRVRIDVSVEPAELEHEMEHVAGHLAEEMKLPGFRKGKVPPQMAVQKLGRETVLGETLQHSLGGWYERALLDAAVSPIGSPKLDVGDLPEEGEPLTFAIDVGVRPPATLGEYKGLEAGRAEVEVPADAVDAEMERLREASASLETVERAAGDGDLLLIDFTGSIDGEPFEGGEARDYLYELGSGRLIEGFEQTLNGASAGEDHTVEITFPDDYGAEELRGKQAQFATSVKEVREKKLPELDDAFAAQASEFETIAELREEVSSRIGEALGAQNEERFREAALDAAVAEATIDIPDAIVEARAVEAWERIERQLGERGISPESYLQMQDKTREELIAESRPDAEKALKREAVLEAIAEAEQIEVTDEEIAEALAPVAEREGIEPEALVEQLRASGREKLIAGDLRMRKALDLLGEEAKPIPLEQAEAREAIWTPDKEREEKGGLWTPDSPE